MSVLSNKPPDEELAAEIVQALAKVNLLDPPNIEKTQERIATGTMTREDWRLLLDAKRPKRARSSKSA